MKILFVSPEVPTFGGAGIATYISEATRALTSAGHECHVLTWFETPGKSNRRAEHGHILHVRSPTTESCEALAGVDSDLRISHWVADWVLELQRAHAFDIIEGTDWCAPLYCLLQRRNVEPLLRNTMISVFNHGTTYNIARHQQTFTPRQVYQRVNLEHQCFRMADIVICPSVAASESLVTLHDAPQNRIVVIPEPLIWNSRTSNETAAPQTLLYFGSVSASKGVLEFINVANRLLLANPSMKIEFVGPIHALDEDERAYKRMLTGRLATVADRVVFKGAAKRQDAIGDIGPHHVLINMSPRETFCYTFAEGLMRGALPIALKNSAQAEFIPLPLRDRYTVSADLEAIAAFDADAVCRRFERDRAAIIEHARDKTAPEAYVKSYEELIGAGKGVRSRTRGAELHAGDVTVLIPAHNPDDYLLETLQSIRDQSTRPRQILIGDDGTDEVASRAVLDEASRAADVTVLKFDWRGLAETRNRLLAACQTKLFAFVDADDLLLPNFTEVSLQFLNANYESGVRSVQGWYELFGAQTGVRGPVVFQHFTHSLWNDLKNNHLGVTDVFRDLRYNSGLLGGEAEDWELWLRYFRDGWATRVIPQVLWRYRRHERALSSHWSEAMSVGTARANARILRAYLAENPAAHVWDFIGEYMYLGETFFSSFSRAKDDVPRPQLSKSMSKLERRLSKFQSRGKMPNIKQRAAIRLMRSLARTLD